MKAKPKTIALLLLLSLLFSMQVYAKDGSVIPPEGFATTLNTNPLVNREWLNQQIVLTENDRVWNIRIADLGDMPMLLTNDNGTAAGIFTDASALNAQLLSINNTLAVIPADGNETIFDRTSGAYQTAQPGIICQLRHEFSDLLSNSLAAQVMSDAAPSDIQINLNDGHMVGFPPGKRLIIAGTCTTSLKGSSANRIGNITLAASHLNGLVIQPGQTLSISTAIKPRTAANGYREAGAYLNGETVQALGGGICQLSSTAYNAVMNSGLTVIERHPHSMPVHYLPLGLDAAIAEGTKDLIIRNDYDLPVTLQAGVTGNKLTISVILNESLLNGQTYRLWSTVPAHNFARTYLSTYDAAGAETSQRFIGVSRYADPKPKLDAAAEGAEDE